MTSERSREDEQCSYLPFLIPHSSFLILYSHFFFLKNSRLPMRIARLSAITTG